MRCAYPPYGWACAWVRGGGCAALIHPTVGLVRGFGMVVRGFCRVDKHSASTNSPALLLTRINQTLQILAIDDAPHLLTQKARQARFECIGAAADVGGDVNAGGIPERMIFGQ